MTANGVISGLEAGECDHKHRVTKNSFVLILSKNQLLWGNRSIFSL